MFLLMVSFKTKFLFIVLELSGSEHLYWILNLDVVHITWVLCTSNLQVCKGNVFFEVGWRGQQFFGQVQKKNLEVTLGVT